MDKKKKSEIGLELYFVLLIETITLDVSTCVELLLQSDLCFKAVNGKLIHPDIYPVQSDLQLQSFWALIMLV